MTHFNNTIITYIDCIGVDEKLHICEPDKEVCKCGVKVKFKNILKNDYIRYNCYKCTY